MSAAMPATLIAPDEATDGVALDALYRDSSVGDILDALDRELIGLAPVKRRLREIAAFLVVSRAREKLGLSDADFRKLTSDPALSSQPFAGDEWDPASLAKELRPAMQQRTAFRLRLDDRHRLFRRRADRRRQGRREHLRAGRVPQKINQRLRAGDEASERADGFAQRADADRHPRCRCARVRRRHCAEVRCVHRGRHHRCHHVNHRPDR